jgi:hypothetical protein
MKAFIFLIAISVILPALAIPVHIHGSKDIVSRDYND